MKFPEYFDPRKPTVPEIREHYGSRFIDLTTYRALTHENVAEGVMEASRKGWGVVMPEGPGVYQFWDRGATVNVKGRYIPLDSALRFMKFGPSVDITRRSTTATQLREGKMTPRKLFREALGSADAKEMLLKGSYRGIGWWDPKGHAHRLLPFDVPAEGEKFADFYGDEMRFGYQHADAYVTVPSLSRGEDREYVVTMRVLPVTLQNDAYLHEWAMTEIPCGCEDRFFRGAAGQLKADPIRNVYKYAIPEEPFCRHGWGSLAAAQKRGDKGPEAEKFRVKFPTVRGLMAPWYVLSTATIIKPQGKPERRPLKTEVRIQLGRQLGYMGPEYMFDLTE